MLISCMQQGQRRSTSQRIMCGETNIPAALPTTIEITSANVKEAAQSIGHTLPGSPVPNALVGP
jgi:hypothetical protein